MLRPDQAPAPAESGAPGHTGTPLLMLQLLAVAAIAALDALTPPGVVVGVLLVIPVFAAGASRRPHAVAWTFGAATIAYGVATAFGVQGGSVAGDTRIANRVLIVVTLAAAAYLATALQHQRTALRSHRLAEVDAVQTNRLLLSLIMHDLRNPLITALNTLEYLWARVTGEDQSMVEDARARLRRNVRLVDAYLAVAQADRTGVIPEARSRYLTVPELNDMVREEVQGFRPEAVSRGKRIVLYHAAARLPAFSVDVVVMRHALTILLDNAVRYAVPGLIRVTTESDDHRFLVHVEDAGPGTGGSAPPGTGLGLELCRSLLQRAGGELRLDRTGEDGTSFVLQLPISAAAHGAPPVTVVQDAAGGAAVAS